MSSESTVLNRVKMFESATPTKQAVGGSRARQLSRALDKQRRDDRNHDRKSTAALTPTKKHVGVRNVDWPQDDDDKDIPPPRKQVVDRQEDAERRDAPPLQSRSVSQPQWISSRGGASRNGEHDMHQPSSALKSRVEKRVVDSNDENINPVGAALEWPSEDSNEERNPAYLEPSPKKVQPNSERRLTDRMNKLRLESRRQVPASMTAQPSPATVKNEAASTKSHLNDALKRSLADATTVLHEERASSVATSSSSLSSDELTNIAKRAMQSAQLKRTSKPREDDDGKQQVMRIVA